MPAFCTCGTELAPDSLFCHKCGKPQREIAEVQPEVTPIEPPPPPAPVVPPAAATPDFRNPIAVRVAFTVALISTLLSWIPVVGILLWGAGGYFAVLLYRRYTGLPLNVKAGMRLGWITGVMLFGLTTIVNTISLLPTAVKGGLSELFKQQIKNPSDPNVQEVLRFLDTAPGIITVLLTGLTMLFVVITLLSMAGGALGARQLSRSR
jgi:hypothetical protein